VVSAVVPDVLVLAVVVSHVLVVSVIVSEMSEYKYILYCDPLACFYHPYMCYHQLMYWVEKSRILRIKKIHVLMYSHVLPCTGPRNLEFKEFMHSSILMCCHVV